METHSNSVTPVTGDLQVHVQIKKRKPFKAGAELCGTVSLDVQLGDSEEGVNLTVRFGCD